MRIRFWGVQGSCPMFPEPHEVEEYKWVVAQDAIRRVLADIREASHGGPVTVEQLLGGLSDAGPAALAAYQRKLGTPDLPVYGGETTCIIIETADDNVIVLDGGSGIRNGSKHMIRNWGDRPRTLHILASHEHLDHRSGLPFCQFCFVRPPFDVHVYGTGQFLNALDTRYGIYSRQITPQTYYDDPIDYRMMSAKFSGIEIPGTDGRPLDLGAAAPRPWDVHAANEPIRIGATTVTPFDVYHGPTRCLAYKIRHGPATFVFCTDHELRHGPDPADPRQARSLEADARLAAHCQDADLAYFDGQYFLDEYHGRRGIGVNAAVPRVDWGHGCIEDVIDRCRRCRVRHGLVGHHDPERSWQERIVLDRRLITESADGPCKIELAKSDMIVDL
jgi:ribonuclease BN (tRNA processing enzyme)